MAGDLVVGVDDKPVEGMAEFFRGVWSLGNAGIDVPLNVYRDGDLTTVPEEDRSIGRSAMAPASVVSPIRTPAWKVLKNLSS